VVGDSAFVQTKKLQRGRKECERNTDLKRYRSKQISEQDLQRLNVRDKALASIRVAAEWGMRQLKVWLVWFVRVVLLACLV